MTAASVLPRPSWIQALLLADRAHLIARQRTPTLSDAVLGLRNFVFLKGPLIDNGLAPRDTIDTFDAIIAILRDIVDAAGGTRP